MNLNWLQENHSNKIKIINYLFLIVIFGLNFLGTPLISTAIVAYMLFVFFTILFFDLDTSLQVIIAYSFIEGQGRIVLGFSAISKIAFDLIIVVAALRNFVAKRSIKTTNLLPRIMLFLIILHFLWYLVELFNIDSINIFAAIAATKIYVFPFFLLVFFRQNEETFNFENLKQIGYMVFIILLAEAALCVYQFQMQDQFLVAMSPHYKKAMKGDVFTLNMFRPFGTSFLPGAISAYFFLSIGLIFVKKNYSKLFLTLTPLLISFLFVIFIVAQVRSATIKFFIILFGIFVVAFINSKKRVNLGIKMIAAGILIIPILSFYLYPKIEGIVNHYINLQAGLKRWEGLDPSNVTSHRGSFDQIYEIAVTKLREFPLGVGPGMTGATLQLSVDKIKSDPIYTLNTFWNWENFFLSLIIEFGYGFIFYSLYILSVPVVLLSYFRKAFIAKDFTTSRNIGISLVIVCVIIMGNWGAVGLPYNPESFYFWLWTAIGFNSYHLFRKQHNKAT